MLNTVSEKCDWYTYVASTLLWIVVVFLRKILMGEDIDSRRADINGVMPDISIIILLRNYFWIQHEDKYGCKLKYLMYRLSERSIVLSYII
jgi:hypothetical protein